MAGETPTTPPTTLVDQTALIEKTTTAFSGYSTAMAKARTVIEDLQGQMASLGSSISAQETLTRGQVQAFNLVTTAALGAREAFQGLGNIDTGGLSTFTGQIKQLEDILAQSPLAKAAKKELDDVMNAAKKVAGGITGDIGRGMIEAAERKFKEATNFISDETKALAQNADNASRLRDVYFGLASSTGNWGAANENAGTRLQNLNKMVALQQETLDNTKMATGLSAQEVEKYYTQLGTIPGALDASTASLKGMTGGNNLLISSMRLAKGAGMDYGSVIEGMKKAVIGYGASIPEALVYTARMGEVAQKFGVNLDAIKQEVLSTSDAFKMFGKDTTSAVAIMNQYLDGLKQTGLSGAASANIVGNMTRQISQLTTAQKAFISAQAGGPGGLQGAYGIDMMLRQQGGQQKVMEMVMKTMRQQMGPLVNTEEASQGGAAAGQFTKQIMMLQNFGLAKSTAEAEHLIDAMKLMSEGKSQPKELKTEQQLVQGAVERGNQYQKQTATGVSQLVALIEQSRGLASGASLSLIQSGNTAMAGEQFDDMDAVADNRAALNNAMDVAGKRDPLEALLRGGDSLKNKQGQQGVISLQDWGTYLKQIPDMVQAPLDGIRGMLKEGRLGEADQNYAAIVASIERQKTEAGTAPAAARDAKIAELERTAQVTQAVYSNMKNAALNPPKEPEQPKVQFTPKADLSDLGIPGENIKNAAARAATRSLLNPNAPSTGNVHTHTPAPAGPESLGSIEVNLTTYCAECHQKIAGDGMSRSIHTPIKKRI